MMAVAAAIAFSAASFAAPPATTKKGTDISGTLLPVLRSRNGLQFYKPRAMPCNGFRHRRQLRTARWGRSIRRSSGAQVTNLQPTVVGAKRGRAREDFASSGRREVTGLGEGSGTPRSTGHRGCKSFKNRQAANRGAPKRKAAQRRPFEVKMRRLLSCARGAHQSVDLSQRVISTLQS